VRSILEELQQGLPGSRVEEKEESLVFHWRASDRRIAERQVRELELMLRVLVGGEGVRIERGDCVLEVRNGGGSKALGGCTASAMRSSVLAPRRRSRGIERAPPCSCRSPRASVRAWARSLRGRALRTPRCRQGAGGSWPNPRHRAHVRDPVLFESPPCEPPHLCPSRRGQSCVRQRSNASSDVSLWGR
jgi:hypothetical protein